MIFVSLSARCHSDSGPRGVVHISCDPRRVLDGDQPPLVLYKVYNVYNVYRHWRRVGSGKGATTFTAEPNSAIIPVLLRYCWRVG